MGQRDDAESTGRRGVHLCRGQGARRGRETRVDDHRRRDEVRRLEVPKTTGLNRATWNLRADPASAEGGRGEGGRGEAGRWRTRCRGRAGEARRVQARREPARGSRRWWSRGGESGRGWARGRRAGRRGRSTAVSGRGRGGPQGALVAPGRYRATLGRLTGETLTPMGSAQSFQVVALPR